MLMLLRSYTNPVQWTVDCLAEKSGEIRLLDMLHSRSLTNCSESVCTITNTNLTGVQWIQASLPVKKGGLGVRHVSPLAPSAILVSAASARDLQDMILSKCDASVDPAVSSVSVDDRSEPV